MSHRDQILKRLREAGDRGIHSFQLLDITPRYAARICELNKLGYEISSVPERHVDAIGVRYTLAGRSREGAPPPPGSPALPTASSQETVLSLDDARRVAPSMYDPMEGEAA